MSLLPTTVAILNLYIFCIIQHDMLTSNLTKNKKQKQKKKKKQKPTKIINMSTNACHYCQQLWQS